MITYRDITPSKITMPEVFRHTPFEHETTTDGGVLVTTVGATTVMVTRQYLNEMDVAVPASQMPAP
jgi:hypothetical protein